MESSEETISIEDLRCWVTAFRKACEAAAKAAAGDPDYGYFSEFPSGQCLNSVRLLAQFLHDKCGVPACWMLECYDAWRDGQSHAWLRVSGWIVDITADQFDDGGDVEFVTQDEAWHQTFSTPVVDEFVPIERIDDFGAAAFFRRYDLILAHLEPS